ncbi:insulinase family protein [Kordia sp. TARA_039_SRF]|nr:insulinase family protein [Kordia sp. TARA_039_SRF]MAF31654.1 peptidase M16 [Magnetococcales bacterium]|tara:strand:+ start:417 stop:1649 length:1233 start_codon:yes stop_codon:yes gene_type:complete
MDVFMDTFNQTTLANGLTVVTETLPHVESVSMGVYVRTGSRTETAENSGVAHFLEHMAFKGTHSRSAEEIAMAIEDVGGNINAYTSRETTAYHLKVLKEDAELGVDILSDIIQNPAFLEEEFKREQGVILQELAASLDEPEEIVFDNLQEIIYPDHAMGWSILGTKKSILEMNIPKLKAFMKSYYHPENMVVSIAGNIQHQTAVDLCTGYFNKLTGQQKTVNTSPTYHAGARNTHKDLEQSHIALCFNAMSSTDPHFYAANIFTSILGGGMTSRLFQEIREKRGLAYSIYAYLASYSDCGTFGIYAGTDASQVQATIEVAQQEIQKLQQNITVKELNRAKVGLLAGLKMSLESTDSRMGRMAKNHFLYGRHMTIEEIVNDIERITLDEVIHASKVMTNPDDLALSTLGRQ